jgi:hypothetical protein
VLRRADGLVLYTFAGMAHATAAGWTEERIEDLIQQLWNDKTWKAAEAELLSLTPKPTAVLLGLLSSQALETRKRMVILLGKLKDIAVIPALALALQDETDSAIRRAAIIALGRFRVVEALDIVEDYKSDLSSGVAQAAAAVVMKLRCQLADELHSELDTEGAPGPAAPERPAFGTKEIQPILPMEELCQSTVRELLDEILGRDQPLARLELIRRVSRRFGRDHLIRVRQFVNRYVFPAAASGDIYMEDDVLRLPLERTWGRA